MLMLSHKNLPLYIEKKRKKEKKIKESASAGCRKRKEGEIAMMEMDREKWCWEGDELVTFETATFLLRRGGRVVQ